jgi:hypothetical protein
MFDVTSDEIAELNDEDLRSLVARLCEAELSTRGMSPAAVTWGGHQTAPDGGLDVRVALPLGTVIEGFVPRPSVGFQVKKPDMPKGKIISEMRPEGAIRAVIQKLVDEEGAYIIVSSAGSTADSALSDRKNAMREALIGIVNADQLQTDFYDRSRLATWVRCHPGLITWVKEKVGRALVGWRPHGPWSGGAEGTDAEYLLDEKLRLHLGKQNDAPAQSVAQAIDDLRDELTKPGKVVRLVGLSGVGKTRLVQALFDTRIGLRPLSPELAVYTNLSDNPSPQPIGLASDLIAKRTRAVLVVDNCPPDLHRRLSELCSAPNSTVSMITVEYDVRDDQPEGTQLVTLETSSAKLIEQLVRRRYPYISQVDANSIADTSGGNARIAIALAETVDRSESIAGLSDEDLFQRLFRQRHAPDNALFLAAQACSLVYSFQGEALTGDEAELHRLASLVEQTPREIYRLVEELRRRDLVQKRGVWRAVLPHAIANRLAARALEDIPHYIINQQLVEGGSERLTRSFSRRLSYLHDHPRVIEIVERWLATDGLLGDVTDLNDLKRGMFENVAPVLPELTLLVLERADNEDYQEALSAWCRHQTLLRSLAYDPNLFERSVDLLAQAATKKTNEREAKQAADVFVSLFPIYLSGTHATIEQRLRVIERLLISIEAKPRSLGLAALDAVLQSTHFSSGHKFEFGARSRDYGYCPSRDDDMGRWYGSALALIERLALTEEMLKPELRALVAKHFRGLWIAAHLFDDLEALTRKFAADGFWREGWAACRQTIRFDKGQLTPDTVARLSVLETELRPSNLLEKVRAVVLGNRSGGIDLEEMDVGEEVTSAHERLNIIARDLGAAVAVDNVTFVELLPELLRGGSRVWEFSCGLARESADLRVTWEALVQGLEQVPLEQRNVDILRGYLSEVWIRERELAQNLLDLALDESSLVSYLPLLHSGVEIDERGVGRLKQVLNSGQVPISMYQYLAFGHATDMLSGRAMKDLLTLIADQTDGFDVAFEILFMRLYTDRLAKREHEPELLETGRELLQGITFGKSDQRDHSLAEVVEACLVSPDADLLAADLASRLRQAVANYETYSIHNDNLLEALLKVQPVAVLNALFDGNETSQLEGINVFDHISDLRTNPTDVIPSETLIAWCEKDREKRYPLAASISTLSLLSEASGPQVWTKQALALLAGAPNPKEVLAVFSERLRPMSWSGSRAVLMEANAKLLDDLELHVNPGLMQAIREAKNQLTQAIERERRWETEQDRARDERFE